MTRKIVIAGACRTAIGSMGGSLSTVSSTELGAVVIRESLKRAGIAAESVDYVYMGSVLQASRGQNVARQASLKAGLPVEVPAVTVNVVCASGLHSVNLAARQIISGEAEIVVAGGIENMSQAPYAIDKARFGYRLGHGELVDTMIKDGLTDAVNGYHMGITAENICDRWNLTRSELDEFAVGSQRKAAAAVKEGRFIDEIVPVEIKKRKEISVFSVDEGPRFGITVDKISGLAPAFKADGIVTAANSSSINDGGAAVVVLSEEKAKELGVKPMAKWIDGTLAGVDPAIMGIGPVASTNKLLKRRDMTIEDLDLVEANEAFAAQSVVVQRDLKIPSEILNVNGGAIALGHPVGCSGTRILVTLLYELERRQAETGLATLCVGGGMGCSTIVRRTGD